MTPVRIFPFAGFALVNVGVLPARSDAFTRELAEFDNIRSALGFEASTANFRARRTGVRRHRVRLEPDIEHRGVLHADDGHFLNAAVALTTGWYQPRYNKTIAAA